MVLRFLVNPDYFIAYEKKLYTFFYLQQFRATKIPD